MKSTYHLTGFELKTDYRVKCKNITRHTWQNDQCTRCGLIRIWNGSKTLYFKNSVCLGSRVPECNL